MKYLVWLASFIDIYLGFRFFLNVIHVLHTSKYSQSATIIYAILFLSMGLCGLYFSLLKNNDKLALIICIGPWILFLLFLFFTMISSDYK